MRTRAKAAGVGWSPEKQLWLVIYGQIAGTPLEKHIHIDDALAQRNNERHIYVYTWLVSTYRYKYLQIYTSIYM
jgi:hypothetical protein